jgi:subtilisin family serine protease
VKLRAFAATIAVIVGLVTFSATTSSAISNRSVRASSEEVQAYAAGRYIVKVRNDASPDEVLNSYPSIKTKAHVFQSVLHGFAVELTSDEATGVAVDSRVLSIVPDQIIRVDAPQDRSTVVTGDGDEVWGIDRIDQTSLPLNQQFTALTSGEGVYVYVVDTGVRTTHTQFTGRVLPGYASPDLETVEDCDGHGTHVAGTVLGSKVGVAPSAKLIPVRVLDCYGSGSYSDVIIGLDWIAQDIRTNNRRPAVVNMSLGGLPSPELDSAVTALFNVNVSVVVAAGNDGANACNVSPARTPAAITVAASDDTDAEATFDVGSSNYGSCVDLFAPGKYVLSAWHEDQFGNPSNFAGAILDGTSMAAPHVAGVVALMLESNPCATPTQLADALISNSAKNKISFIPLHTPQSPDRLLQTGSISGTPCAPKSVSASRGDSQADITWSLPTGPGGSTNFTYTVTTSPASSGCTTTQLNCTVTGLINGQTYNVSVKATNEFGTSATSATTTVTPEGVPIAPTISGFTIGNASATVSWGSVPSTSTVTYTATAQPGGQSCSTTQLTCTIPGLTNGATYTFTVVAANISGAGAASVAAVAATYTTPPAPVVSRIRTKSKQITLTWNALEVPYALSYTVRVAGTNKSCVTTTTSCTVTKLTNGKRYRLTVTATNIAGDGLPSQRTPYVVPGINVLRNTITKKKKVLLSKFMTTLSAGRKTYKVTKGACRISSGYLVAPSRAGSCTLQLSVSASGVYPSMYNTANIKVT